jgi:hypothetical protein
MGTISLREVALRLARIKEPTTKRIDHGWLLSLLREGDLRAGFEYPGFVRRWIPIQPTYWLNIDSGKFRSIRSDGEYTFKVRPRDFAEDYLNLVPSTPSESLKEEFRVFLEGVSRKFEVVIQDEEWKRFLVAHKMQEPTFDTPKVKGRGGRYPMAAWDKLAVIIPAYLLAHHSEKNQPPNYRTAAEQIYEMIVTSGIDKASVPKPDRLKDVISEVYRKKESILQR